MQNIAFPVSCCLHLFVNNIIKWEFRGKYQPFLFDCSIKYVVSKVKSQLALQTHTQNRLCKEYVRANNAYCTGAIDADYHLSKVRLSIWMYEYDC